MNIQNGRTYSILVGQNQIYDHIQVYISILYCIFIFLIEISLKTKIYDFFFLIIVRHVTKYCSINYSQLYDLLLSIY